MIPIKKFLIGVRPPVKSFRVASLWGDIADALLEARADSRIGDEYFKKVGTNAERDTVNLSNEDGSTNLTVSTQDVIFSKHGYFGGSTINASKALSEFQILWRVLQDVLKVREVRRIGMIGEVRVDDVETPSRLLLEKLVKTELPSHPAHFRLQWESRTAKPGVTTIDTAKDDFENVIYHFYDSALDVDDKSEGSINANLDFQRYYEPWMGANNLQVELGKHFRAFEDRMRDFKALLAQLGLRRE